MKTVKTAFLDGHYMDEYEKINEAIDYIRWMIKELDPDDMYNFKELRQNLLSIIGYLVMLKS